MARGISRHNEVISYLRQFLIKYNRMPTRKEIQYDIRIGQGALNRILNGLENNQKLKRLPNGILNYEILRMDTS